MLIPSIFCLYPIYGINYNHFKILDNRHAYLIAEIFAIIITIVTEQIVSAGHTVITILSYLLYMMLCFEGGMKKRLLILLLLIVSIFGGELIANFILSYFFDISYLKHINSVGFTLVSILSGSITFMFSYLLTKIAKGIDWENYPKYVYLIFLLPITTILLLVNLKDYSSLITNDKILIITLIILVISNFVSFFIFIDMIQITRNLNEITIKKESTEVQYEHITKLYNSNFNFMHNIIRKLMKIQSKIDQNDYDDLKEELYQLNQSVLHSFNMINSTSSIIGPIINTYLDIINENDIQCRSVLEYEDFSFLTIADQRCLFRLLLDIAIHSCIMVDNKDKDIILKTVKHNNIICIQMIYTKSEILKIQDYAEKYNQIQELIYNNEGDIGYEEDFNKNVSDIIIIFER